jgi:nucleoside-diphosphate-sugar epimerase
MGIKIAITGHTKGLGAEITKHFGKEHEVLGFSRTNGYDIKSPFDRKKILKASADADVFINLVHNYYHQTDLLLEFFQAWENERKLIINISSAVVENPNWGLDRLDYIEYKNQKISLESMSSLLSKRKSKVLIKDYRISEINFYEDTNSLNSIINEFRLSKK